MAYNNGRENRKWLIWKEAEEKILREHGVHETIIEQIRTDDRGYLCKAQKRRQELNNLFAKMYEDRVKGLLDEENYSMLSVKYRTEQQQLDETIKTVSARLEDAKAETDDAKRWVDLIQKYSAIDELTAPLLNELIEKIAVHQWRKDENGKKVWDIEIYYRFVGKID